MPGVPPTRFVFLGPEATFTEQALLTLPAAARGTRTPSRSVPEALDAVRAGEADAALVPLENSVGGAVGITLDELIDGPPLTITREVVIPVEFVLGAREAVPFDRIRNVAAHPQASAQCRGWLRTHLPQAEVVDVLSNSAAAISAAAGEYDAAICAPIGADRYRLSMLAEKISDHPDAVTRFVLVSRPTAPPAATGDDVTSLAIFISHDRVGALLAVLMELAVRGSTSPASSPGRPVSGSGDTRSSSTAPDTSPTTASARRCRGCTGCAPTSASWARTRGIARSRTTDRSPRRPDSPMWTTPTRRSGWRASAPAIWARP
ncbi:hypothetical protein Psuf_033230 [Phytohabitans suffuscus]|uniref:prephenate dehydratase n=1 Tax=Phytohabitans suffuscus TaxID=624315 RepID=A0A6F8YIV6_9ACTN|nr:hypothetical protein Psuf_033230 [Phytohabitans suffuscus]